MPKIRITSQSDVDNIPYSTDGKQIIWWSTGLDHFGVRAGARDKVYVVGVRVNRQWKLVTLGRAGRITVQKAIRDAKVALGEMIGGIDPTARERARTASGLTLRQAWHLYQQTLGKLNRSAVTLRDYQTKIDCHLSDWLDRPLVSITREACNRLHTRIGEASGPYAANATMRVLRAIWRRTRRQHPELPEPPTVNIDFYPEHGRTAVIVDWESWWKGIQQLANPVRHDFYMWLAFSGCRLGESGRMEVEHVDLEAGVVLFPVTKTVAFEMPLSDFMIELLRKRIAVNGADCQWLFPAPNSASGHLEQERLTAAERKLFRQHWSPHTLRHSWISLASEKVRISDHHQRALTNHRPKRGKSGDAHAGYIHPDLDDLRASQQAMTDYLKMQIGAVRGAVVPFRRNVASS